MQVCSEKKSELFHAIYDNIYINLYLIKDLSLLQMGIVSCSGISKQYDNAS